MLAHWFGLLLAAAVVPIDPQPEPPAYGGGAGTIPMMKKPIENDEALLIMLLT